MKIWKANKENQICIDYAYEIFSQTLLISNADNKFAPTSNMLCIIKHMYNMDSIFNNFSVGAFRDFPEARALCGNPFFFPPGMYNIAFL